MQAPQALHVQRGHLHVSSHWRAAPGELQVLSDQGISAHLLRLIGHAHAARIQLPAGHHAALLRHAVRRDLHPHMNPKPM
jgi:hypothetical protein